MTAKELKASILQLAVTGKLVPQDPNDEPSSVLLERIKAEKAKLVKAGKIKKDKNPSEIVTGSDGAVYEKFGSGDLSHAEARRRGEGRRVSSRAVEVPFEIPKSWRWVRLGDIGAWGAGATPNKSTRKYFENGTIPWLLTGDLNDGLITKIPHTITESALKETSVKLNPQGSVLIAMYGATIGKVGVLNLPATTNQACCACRPFDGVVNWYLFYFLMSQRDVFISRGEGGAQSNISKEKIVATLFPLPPLAEQKRIVAKIEKLMPLVEEYGKLEETRLQLDADLPATLEKSILQEAIQGKLVPQDPNDEPASELLKRIAAERKVLVKSGKLKRDKGESVIFRGSDRLAYETRNGETVCIQDEIPFEIPDSWEWVRLGNVIILLSGRDLEPSEYSASQKKFPYMTGASNFADGKLVVNRWTDKVATISHSGDLLITCKGTIGAMAFNTIGDIHIARQIMAISSHWINLGYVKVYLESIVHSLKSAANSMIPGIDRSTMLNLLIPLPPLNEQKRIVKRVEELKAATRTLVTF